MPHNYYLTTPPPLIQILVRQDSREYTSTVVEAFQMYLAVLDDYVVAKIENLTLGRRTAIAKPTTSGEKTYSE